MPAPPPELAIILVHYHTSDLLERCVDRLMRLRPVEGWDAEIVVIDNGSTAQERPMINALPVRRIDPEKNLGYGAALNRGIEATIAPTLICMNPDVLVLEGCIPALIDSLRQGAAAAGPRFFWDETCCLMIPPTEARTRFSEVAARLAEYGFAGWARQQWRSHARRHWIAQSPLVTPSLSGALIAMRREAWQQIGGFDERYFLYFEETDWLLRLKANGLTSRYVPYAHAIHFYNQSAINEPNAQRWFAESQRVFMDQHYGAWFRLMLERALPHRQPRYAEPAQRLAGLPEINLPDLGETLAIEVSPQPLGFPAACAMIRSDEPRQWCFPQALWQRLPAMRLYIRVTRERGSEIAVYAAEKTRA